MSDVHLKSIFRVIKAAAELCRPKQRSGGGSLAGAGDGRAGRAEESRGAPNREPGGAPRRR